MIEVADADRLIAGRMRADIDAAGPLAVRNLPDIDIVVVGIEPEHVAGAVVIEVAGADRLISGRMRADVDAARPLAVRELPDIESRWSRH